MAGGFVPVAGFEPGIGIVPDTVRVGERFFVMDQMRLLALDLDAPALVWTRDWKRPDPVHYQVPRRPHSNGRRLWSAGDAIVCLIDTEAGVAAVSCDAMSGREVWRREIATPAPADWTETQPAWPGAPTEEIAAGFLAQKDPAIFFARTTRRSMKWPDVPAPPLRAQLDVYALNPADGTIRAAVEVPGVRVPILEKQRLGRWLVADRCLLELDSAAGSIRTVAEVLHEPCWPRDYGGKLTVAWRARGLITAAALDVATGKVEIEHEWKRNATKAVELRPLPDLCPMQWRCR